MRRKGRAAAGPLPAKRVLPACPAVLGLELRSRSRAASAAFYVVFRLWLPDFLPVTPPALVPGPSTEKRGTKIVCVLLAASLVIANLFPLRLVRLLRKPAIACLSDRRKNPHVLHILFSVCFRRRPEGFTGRVYVTVDQLAIPWCRL